jgi:hypothetical protein
MVLAARSVAGPLSALKVRRPILEKSADLLVQ